MSISTMVELEAKVLACLAWADDQFGEPEFEHYRDFLDGCPIHIDVKRSLMNLTERLPDSRSVASELSRVPRAISLPVIKHAYILARIDGHFDKRERDLLLFFASSCGFVTEKTQAGLWDLCDLWWETAQIEQTLIGEE